MTVCLAIQNIADIDRRSPLRMVVGVASLERETRMVDGSQDIIDLRDIPLLNILPQNNSLVEVCVCVCVCVWVWVGVGGWVGVCWVWISPSHSLIHSHTLTHSHILTHSLLHVCT